MAPEEFIGEIELPIEIGLCVFNTTFQVMGISLAYSIPSGEAQDPFPCSNTFNIISKAQIHRG
jgi:hypothetical protein